MQKFDDDKKLDDQLNDIYGLLEKSGEHDAKKFLKRFITSITEYANGYKMMYDRLQDKYLDEMENKEWK